MVEFVCQVLEDEKTNLVHLLSQVEQGKCSNPTAFVQTKNGVQTFESGQQHLQGQLQHRYTGKYNGNASSYINDVHESSKKTSDNKKILKKSGVVNIRSGFGVAIRVGIITFQTYNFIELWNQCTSDGIISATEWLALGVDGVGIISGDPAVQIASTVGTAMINETGIIENDVNAPKPEEDAMEEVCCGLFEFITSCFNC